MTLKITFVSNALNLHMIPLCEAFIRFPGVEFHFVSCFQPSAFRIETGSSKNNEPYVIRAYESSETFALAEKTIMSSDFVIAGSEDERLTQPFLGTGRPFFRYSEHFTKSGLVDYLHIPSIHIKREAESKGNSFMLCASAFAQHDYYLCGLYQNRYLYFGYFPLGNQNVSISNKRFAQSGVIKILWAGRFIDWKHPEQAVKAIEILKKNDISFELTMLGDGPEMPNIRRLVSKSLAKDSIKLIGSVDNSSILKEMIGSDVFLFTSDRGEGWGAVLNEAMSSQCCVIASKNAGATGFLIKDGENGYTFKTPRELAKRLLFVSKNKEIAGKIAENARATILDKWNADVACRNLISVYLSVTGKGEKLSVDLISNGPCTFIR
jgi:glycosyltransferase involved in cell wall biosynthesis